MTLFNISDVSRRMNLLSFILYFIDIDCFACRTATSSINMSICATIKNLVYRSRATNIRLILWILMQKRLPLSKWMPKWVNHESKMYILKMAYEWIHIYRPCLPAIVRHNQVYKFWKWKRMDLYVLAIVFIFHLMPRVICPYYFERKSRNVWWNPPW